MSFVERLQNKFAHVRRDPLFCLKFQLVNSFLNCGGLYRRKCSSSTQDSFILSFDCDTKKDIDVVSEVHKN